MFTFATCRLKTLKKIALFFLATSFFSYFYSKSNKTPILARVARFRSLNGNETIETEVNVSIDNPYVYARRVDFRILVLTTEGPRRHLEELLQCIESLQLDGDEMAVEIWIDRTEAGAIDEETLEVSRNFFFSNDYTTVHVHGKHVGVHNQWLTTYTTKHLKEGERELVLFLGDDLLLSSYGYRWLKAVHKRFHDVPSYLGVSLIGWEGLTMLKLPGHHSVFMHSSFETDAFSPRLDVWTNFQEWFVDHYGKKDFKPLVPEVSAAKWYENLTRNNKTVTIWFLYYAFIEQLYAVYVNPSFLPFRSNFTKTAHCPPGFGLRISGNQSARCLLMQRWKEDYACFPKSVIKLGPVGYLV